MPHFLPELPFGTHTLCPTKAGALTVPSIRSQQAKDAYVALFPLQSRKTIAKLSLRYEHNAQKSPLVRLPAEVRNAIYNHALGGNTLHISRNAWDERPPEFRCRMCLPACICAVSNNSSWSDFEYPLCYEMCPHRPVGPRPNLSLLLACSQVYTEAALMPFIHNTFNFADATILPTFVSSLVASQAAAITTLKLHHVAAFHVFDDDYWTTLTGLRNLTLTIRGHDGCGEGDGDTIPQDCRQFNNYFIRSAREWWPQEPSYAPLSQLSLKTFQFRILCASGIAWRRCRALRQWQQWAKTIELEVSARWSKKEARQRQLEKRLLLQAALSEAARLHKSSLREKIWKIKRWCVLRLSIWKMSLGKRLWLSRRDGS